MTSFPNELDKLIGRRMKELGRVLYREESDAMEGQLFESWIAAGRYDALIRRIHSTYGCEGGHEECAVLGFALQEAGDLARMDTLFRGLINRRVKSFWTNWDQALSGHAGWMHVCAKQAAAAMEAYLEYYNRLANLRLDEQKEALRAEMLAFQARERRHRPGKSSGNASSPVPPNGAT